MKLANKTAFITGGGSGIGRAMAVKMAREGANIAINDLDQGRIDGTIALVEKEGRKAISVPFDVTDLAAVKEAVAKTKADLGTVDILCSNAGIAPTVDFVNMTPEAWDKMLKVHLYGMFNCCTATIHDMIAQKWGRIIITASMSAISGDIFLTHYSAAKAGQVGFARALAREVVAQGVTVNCIAPGLTETAILGEVDEEVKKKYTPPIGRIGTPEDQAATAVFLATDDAEFITGQTIQVNGGAF